MLVQNSIAYTFLTQFSLFLSQYSPHFSISFTSLINIAFHPPIEFLNTIEAFKLNKLGIFFVESMTDSKLMSKLPKCILAFFHLHARTKCLIEIHKRWFCP